jgi:CMP-N-acetylneuraminic acid synthetase
MNATTVLQGRVRTVNIPIERAWDIDTELDLEIADFLLRRRME